MVSPVSPRYASHVKGTGPIVIELWLDYICPFSKKQYLKLYDDIIDKAEKKYPNRFSWVFQHQLQPWHAQGTWLHEAAIAVGLLAPEKFWEFSKILFEESENYYDPKTKDKSRSQIVKELAQLAEKVGVSASDVLEAIDIHGTQDSRVIPDLKYYVRLGRQTGIHISPSVLLNGIVAGDISSSWEADQWIEKLAETSKLLATKI